MQGEHMVVVESTPKLHNLVVCTLCSCYPWAILGLPPVWYKSAPYRSRSVIDPRGVLREFGLELPKDVEVREWTLNGNRHQIELIPATDYLRLSYFEKWFAALLELLVKSDLVTGAEIESGKPAPNATRAIPPLLADFVLPVLAHGNPASRDVVWSRASKWANACAPATCTQPVIRACHATREGGSARSTETTVSLYSRTPTPMFSARSHSTCTRYVSPRASCGATRPRHVMRSVDLWDDYLEPA
jgi:hypothetical protein